MDRQMIGCGNTPTFYKGKSFRYNDTWTPHGHYANSDFIQDFVTYNNSMYVCITTNVGIVPTNTNYWRLVMSPTTGGPIELRVDGTMLQWRYIESETWFDLYDLSEISSMPEPEDDGRIYGRTRSEGSEIGEWVEIECTGEECSEEDLSDQVNGVTDTFHSSYTLDGATVSLYYNGQRQFQGVHYNIVDETIVLTFVPEIGDQLFAIICTGSSSPGGHDGFTPYIGPDGNWWINDENTGVHAAGQDGITPHIGSNGNWWIGNEDTEIHAAGLNGISPHIGENGNWWVGDIDTEVLATGSNGLTPYIGENGNWWIGNEDTGVSAIGDQSEWHFEFRDSTCQSTLLTVVDEDQNVKSEMIVAVGEGLWINTSIENGIPQLLINLGECTLNSFSIISSKEGEAASGSIVNPEGTISVIEGNSRTFTFNAGANSYISGVKVDNIAQTVANPYYGTYTFTNVQAPHTLSVEFMFERIDITVSKVNNGQTWIEGVDVSNGYDDTVIKGNNGLTIQFEASAGYQLEGIYVNGVLTSPTTNDTLVLTNLTVDTTVLILFEAIPPPSYIITASKTGEGTLTPIGAVSVTEGDSQTFTFNASSNTYISEWKVDNTLQPITDLYTGSYTFTDVHTNHTIEVQFAFQQIDITVEPTTNGSVWIGEDNVTEGTTFKVSKGNNSLTLSFGGIVGYQVESIYVNGVLTNPTTESTLVLSNLIVDTTIAITFEEVPPAPLPKVLATINEPLVFEDISHTLDEDGWYYFDLLLSGCMEYGFKYDNSYNMSLEFFSAGNWVTVYGENLIAEWKVSVTDNQHYMRMLYNAIDEVTGECMDVSSPRQYRIKLIEPE